MPRLKERYVSSSSLKHSCSRGFSCVEGGGTVEERDVADAKTCVRYSTPDKQTWHQTPNN